MYVPNLKIIFKKAKIDKLKGKPFSSSISANANSDTFWVKTFYCNIESNV